MTWFKRILWSFILISAVLGATFFFLFQKQGLPDTSGFTYKKVRIEFDEHGIPTLTGANWQELIEAQGYVTAGHRLWQMDLIRRKVSGRLSAWFGPTALEHDRKMQREDRLFIAQREAEAMPPRERLFCDAFAKGVNDFIDQNPWKWGLEYIILRTKPEPWECRDSLLVLLEMNDSLTAIADSELEQYRWKRHLPASWQNFLFSEVHPWNRAYFDTDASSALEFPKPENFLTAAPIAEPKTAGHDIIDPDPVGSNSWGWVGESGSFLANDPHLSYSVPSIWYAIRLRKDAENWVVGASIPGIPGVTIGMSPYYAWTFTNSGEDVDDYLEETLDPSTQNYLHSREQGEARWEPVKKKLFLIEVKGQNQPDRLEAFFTHRGPLFQKPELGPGYYARQWLPLKPGMLRLPTLDLLLGQSLSDFHQAIDQMKTPSQNALVMDRLGNLMYRMTGTGVLRKIPARVPVDALEGEWLGFEAPSTRRRMFLPPSSDKATYLATANERIWVDQKGGHWASEDRKARIVELLQQKTAMTQEDMNRIQIDTSSRFRKLLLNWLFNNASSTRSTSNAMLNAWQDWDGSSQSDPLIFAQSTLAETLISEVLLERIRNHFLDEKDRAAPYTNYARRNWLTAFLEKEDETAAKAFGLTKQALADYVIAKIWQQRQEIKPHHISNRSETQHPFATRIPLLGQIFTVDKNPQWGASDLVLAEKPHYGPSMRLIWNLKDPLASTWNFPLGQSGHVRSKNFTHFHDSWVGHRPIAVFDKRFTWNPVKIAQPESDKTSQAQ